MKAKQATVKPKPVSQLEKHACFCPPTKHDTCVAFVGAGTPYALVFAFVAYHYQGHDMTSCCWLVVMGSERFASPIMGIFCGGLNAYCMRIWPLFLRTSGKTCLFLSTNEA